MSMKLKAFLSQRGDTIIEVMIALAILSAVLGGAYASAGSSVRITRQAQERTESLKVAEEQVERLKIAYGNNSTTLLASIVGDYFCVTDTVDPITGYLVIKTHSGHDNTILNDIVYPPECKKQAVLAGNGVTYYISVTRTQPDVLNPASSIFTVNSRWEGLSTQESVSMAYRL